MSWVVRIIKALALIALGAFLMYCYLWYDVYRDWTRVQCQITSCEVRDDK